MFYALNIQFWSIHARFINMVYFDGIHLMADNLEELHIFAARCGLKREWFQDRRKHPHYDVWGNRNVRRVLKSGAKKVSSRDLIELSKIRYMRLILKMCVICFITSLFSCKNRSGGGNMITGQIEYLTVVIDSCEYLKRYEGYQSGYSFSHKGNCKNPVHYKVIHDTFYIIKK